MNLNVLLLGSGGREHAMAWKISQSEMLDTLYVAPGNPGTMQVAENVSLSLDNFEEIRSFIEANEIHLTVIGPEKPLVNGIVDYLEEFGHKVFGPSQAAAKLEGSKSFANAIMKKNSIPTADYKTFTQDQIDNVLPYIQQKDDYPVVLKADGLAGGKGVFVCQTEEEIQQQIIKFQNGGSLEKATPTLVVEEFMQGEEVSVFAISDGQTAKIIHNAQDHKRVDDGDTGLNTGGMGAYCPTPVLTDELLQQVEKEILLPAISSMILEGHPYRGILYCGLMITDEGPKVVEFNCRFGDPEGQVILASLQSDLLKLIWCTVNGKLFDNKITLDQKYYCCVVLTSGGYPESYKTGKTINGLDEISEEAMVFHAGTRVENGELLTDGGRVLNVVCSGETLEDAIRNTYREVKKISFEGMHYRSDIGVKGLVHLED
jgi:phosphoribosylamine--glycine ligase